MNMICGASTGLHIMALVQMVLLSLVFNYGLAEADFSFASSYGSHMVLHRAPKQATVWGIADGSSVGQTVSFTLSDACSGTTDFTTQVVDGTDGNGFWKVLLPATPAGGPYTLSATLQSETIQLTDLLFGDIWLCSGQRNMHLPVKESLNAEAEKQGASNYPNIRLMEVGGATSTSPQTDLSSLDLAWTKPSAETLEDMSALCWLYGRKLYDYKGVPLGLVASSWGGTRIEAWSSPEALAVCDASTAGKNEKNEPSVLWNAMIHPLLQMTITGVIWHQGEANSKDSPMTYDCTFPTMIRDWREKFQAGTDGQTDEVFPFGFVQIGPFKNDFDEIGGMPTIRWMQTNNTGVAPNPNMPNTFMAVAMDLEDFDSPSGAVHPRDKTTVATRLLYGVRAVFYEEDIKYMGPIPSAYKYTPGASTLKFEFDSRCSPIEVRQTNGFEVCCSDEANSPCDTEDSRWVAAAISTHDKSSVTLSTALCTSDFILGHRYAWRMTPCLYKQCAVYSETKELPAPPYVKMENLKGDGKWHKYN